VVSRKKMEFSSGAFPDAPVRKTDLEQIVSCLHLGQCCSVVAPSNMGKSVLLRSLLASEVREACALAGPDLPLTVFVDCLEAGDSEHAFYEVLLRRVLEQLEDCGAPAATVGTVRAVHYEILRTDAEVTIRSLFATSIRELDRWPGFRLVLILDEFDDVFGSLPPWPFRQLRALRDALGDRLCYVAGSSRHLEQIRSDPETYEFRELFHLNTLVLRPLAMEDSLRFIAYLAAKRGSAVAEDRATLLGRLAGGHPGLLEVIFTVLEESGISSTANVETFAKEIGAEEPARKESQRLWDELVEREQDGLLALMTEGAGALDKEARGALEIKGLVVADGGEPPRVFSPVFEAFLEGELASRRDGVATGVHCDPKTGRLWADGQEITLRLSEAQRKVVRLLCEREGAVCTYEEIAHEVWGVGEGVTPGAIYELVKRVRRKVEPDWREPSYIVTVPGEGYSLQARG
jgi:hypothetical protein